MTTVEDLAPGSILQRMYLQRRMRMHDFKTFCEIGCGRGTLSNRLLTMGLTGIGFDLNPVACEANSERNEEFITSGKYAVNNRDFLEDQSAAKFDVVLSCMVIEHLVPQDVERYFNAAKARLAPNGVMVVFVPSSMRHWGIEDDIAGHQKRYEFEDLRILAKQFGMEIVDLAGLTFPVSNFLFRLSNRLVRGKESDRLAMSAQAQTVLSGARDVKYKTVFPRWMQLILNEVVMLPFYLLQRLFRNHRDSMVIYCEMRQR